MAETRTIRTVLELNAQRFQAGAAQASASARSLAQELGRIGDAQGAGRANFDRVSNSLLGIGTAAAAGLGLATKAAMGWETAWAGVTKTVDGTPEQLARVEDGLRGLARELPASHQEIAAVAEAAGQLGVETDSVVEFTRTMINLGETTNLSAEEAATSLARFSNIMGTSQDDVDRLGSALVGLGNSYATTEAEIMHMGMRLAGVGAQLNLTEGEVLGLATAMSSVGIEAEAGGTAMSMGMKKIQAAVDAGGSALEGFAEVAGMSADEFQRLWQDDAAAGLDAFVQGLARVGEEGGNVSSTLSDLGIKGIRESDTFLRLAGASDILTSALEDGNREFEQNIALVEEANKRYATTESQLRIAKNALVDAGIDLGAVVLPVLADVAESVADVAGWFAALPDPVKESAVVLGTLAAGTGLVAGGLMKIIPAATDTVRAFRDLKVTSPQTASALGKVGKAAGGLAVFATAATALAAYGDSLTDFTLGANEAAETIDKLRRGQGSAVFAGLGDEAQYAATSTEQLASELDILANGHWYEGIANMETGIRNAFGAGLATTDDYRQRLEQVGTALTQLYSQDAPAATDAFNALWEEFGSTEEAGLNLLKTMPQLRDHLIGIANDSGLATDDLTLLKIATGEITPTAQEAGGAVEGYGDATQDATGAVEEQVDALQDLQDKLQGVSDVLLGTRGSARDFQAAIDEATSAVEQNGATLDITTEAGRANEAALDGIAAATHRWADAAQQAGADASELDGIMSSGRDAFMEAAEAMGLGADEAAALADQLGLMPGFVETEVKIETEKARADWQALWDEVGYHPPEVPVNADTSGAEEDVQLFTGLVGSEPMDIGVTADTTEAEAIMGAFLLEYDQQTGTYTVLAQTDEAMEEVADLTAAIGSASGTVTINGDTVNANSALGMVLEEIDASDGTVTINGESVPAEQALARVTKMVNDGEGTITIQGNNTPANEATDQAKRKADSTRGTIDVGANTSGAENSIGQAARPRTADINAQANTSGAESRLNNLARPRNVFVNVWERVRKMAGRADGGWVAPGLSDGGWVPGPYPGPGVDNVMWPSLAGAAGGRFLSQPLAGTEFVVNGRSAAQWGPALEAINAGVTRAELAALIGAGAPSRSMTYAPTINGPDARVVSDLSFSKFQHWAHTESTGTRGA